VRQLRIGEENIEDKKRKKKPPGKNIMPASATQGGHNNVLRAAYFCIYRCRPTRDRHEAMKYLVEVSMHFHRINLERAYRPHKYTRH